MAHTKTVTGPATINGQASVVTVSCSCGTSQSLQGDATDEGYALANRIIDEHIAKAGA